MRALEKAQWSISWSSLSRIPSVHCKIMLIGASLWKLLPEGPRRNLIYWNCGKRNCQCTSIHCRSTLRGLSLISYLPVSFSLRRQNHPSEGTQLEGRRPNRRQWSTAVDRGHRDVPKDAQRTAATSASSWADREKNEKNTVHHTGIFPFFISLCEDWPLSQDVCWILCITSIAATIHEAKTQGCKGGVTFCRRLFGKGSFSCDGGQWNHTNLRQTAWRSNSESQFFRFSYLTVLNSQPHQQWIMPIPAMDSDPLKSCSTVPLKMAQSHKSTLRCLSPSKA